MKKILLLLSLILSFNLGAQTLPIDTTAGWALEWSDEFDYPDADLDKNWNSANGSTDNDIVLCSRWRENAVVKDGVLELQARKENRGGQEWTAGSIWTKSNEFKYGYYEAKYKYAAATGTNNSFWLYPYSKKDAGFNKVELDINEGQYPKTIKTNIHNWTKGDTEVHPIQETYSPRVSNLSDEYHTYGLLWTATEHIFYYDGEEIRREANPAYVQKNKWNTDGSWVYVENHGRTQILLSLAILGHDYAGPVTDAIDGTSMKVDYVRYYTLDESAALPEAAVDAIKVYPNPATDEVLIEAADVVSIEVYSTTGTKVKSMEKTAEPMSVSISDLPQGVFILKMKTQTGTVATKLLQVI